MTLVKRLSSSLDCCGATASSLCAEHCFLCALFPSLFGLLGLGSLLSHQAEWILTAIAIAFACLALVFSWSHRRDVVASFLIVGIVGLLVSRGLEAGDDHHHEQHASHTYTEGHEHNHHASTHVSHQKHHSNKTKAHVGHHGDGHHDDHPHKNAAGHLIGALVGILAGLCLFIGHLLNLRAIKRCSKVS